jgi:prepilin-type N-terminal cleavage/methylation domain-containing protein
MKIRRNNVEKTGDRKGGKAGFTIVELLTVMSIIVILISMLVPALNKVRRFAMDVKERAQLHAIGTGLEAFSAENDGYPDSNAIDDTGASYCGAMKLAEAMVGQDLKGFNPDSRFRRDGFGGLLAADAPWDGMPYPPYGTIGVTPDTAGYAENIKKRKTYLQLENANATQIRDIWSASDITSISGTLPGGSFEPNSFVLCDVYSKVTNKTTGRKIGMPILYYKADPTKTQHPADGVSYASFLSNTITNPNTCIYDFRDNLYFVFLPLPWNTNCTQPMAYYPSPPCCSIGQPNPMLFYQKIRNKKVSSPWPYRADTFILLSAGYDGEYGTGDDIFNFGE